MTKARNADDVYAVKSVIDKRTNQITNELEYRVVWEDYPGEDTWEYEDDLGSCAAKLKEFKRADKRADEAAAMKKAAVAKDLIKKFNINSYNTFIEKYGILERSGGSLLAERSRDEIFGHTVSDFVHSKEEDSVLLMLHQGDRRSPFADSLDCNVDTVTFAHRCPQLLTKMVLDREKEEAERNWKTGVPEWNLAKSEEPPKVKKPLVRSQTPRKRD